MGRRLLVVVVLAVVGLQGTASHAQTGQISVLLAPGWNNVGYVGATRPLREALASITGRWESVWYWDAVGQRWLGVHAYGSAADFGELRQNNAYWIRMLAPGELVMQVPAGRPEVVLRAGWNNFVYQGLERPVAQALEGVAGRYQAVWQWDAARQTWAGFTPASAFASDLKTLAPNRSYFVYLEAGPQVVLVPAVTPSPTPTVSAQPTGTGTPAVGASRTPTPTPRPLVCYGFQSYQPQMAEVSRAEERAGHILLTTDPDFKVPDLETQPDGDGGKVAAYVPPTLLKAIGWIESGWRQASFSTPRGSTGPTVTSTSCAYGLMQILSGMQIEGTPTPKQRKIGTEYLANIAAAVQLLAIKWNLAPDTLPAVLPRNPRVLEDWYYAVWAYHCYGDVCDALGIRNNPDDPALKWPRPMYNSPEQLASGGQFTFTDYPYQELVYGVIAHPPKVNGAPLWSPLPVVLPPKGTVGFPEPRSFLHPGITLDPTQPDGQ